MAAEIAEFRQCSLSMSVGSAGSGMVAFSSLAAHGSNWLAKKIAVLCMPAFKVN